MVVLLVFILATLEIALGGKKNCLTEENSGEMYKIVTGAADKKYNTIQRSVARVS